MKTPSNDGGSAFPVMYVSEGMTLRDYFAGQALAGILSSANFGDARDWLPDRAYGLADAMLAARERKEEAP